MEQMLLFLCRAVCGCRFRATSGGIMTSQRRILLRILCLYLQSDSNELILWRMLMQSELKGELIIFLGVHTPTLSIWWKKKLDICLGLKREPPPHHPSPKKRKLLVLRVVKWLQIQIWTNYAFTLCATLHCPEQTSWWTVWHKQAHIHGELNISNIQDRRFHLRLCINVMLI